MNQKIQQLIQDIDTKKKELQQEYELMFQEWMEKYDFYMQRGKVVFSQKAKVYQRHFREGLLKYVFTVSFRHLVSIPFIYAMIVPVIFLDIFLTVYQQVCFRLYGIPLVKRTDYIIYDRHLLGYLNLLQKVNCVYCSYVNGFFQYAVEVGGRTEKYRCPIKHATKKSGAHSREEKFADYGDIETFKKEMNNNTCFHGATKTEAKTQ